MRPNSNKSSVKANNSKFGKLIKQPFYWLIQRLSWEIRLTAKYLSFGTSLRQWAAMGLICVLLLPILVAPASSATNTDNNSIPAVEEELQFESANAPQSIWQSIKQEFNLSVERTMSNVLKPEIKYFKGDENAPKKPDDSSAKNKKAESSGASENSKTAPAPNSKISGNDENPAAVEQPATQAKNTETKPTKNENISGAGANQLAASQPVTVQSERPILSDPEVEILFSSQSNLGNPLGQNEAQSAMPPAATNLVERSGIGNFNFGFPVVSLPGRGLDVSIGASYNSQVWTKSGSQYIYNIDGNWLSPGFQIGYGYLDAYRDGTAPPESFVLTDPDGTRHSVDYIRGSSSYYDTFLYESNDGSFTRVEFERCGSCVPQYQGFLNNMRVTSADGSKIFYSGPNSQNRYFPSKIVDAQGNFISITYLANDEIGKISTITDTLGRVINFHYDSSSEQKLIAVSVPGYDNSTTPRQTIRFYYENLTLQTTNRFDGTITAPPSVTVLKYIYMPGTKTGFRYDYSSYYGMIYKITRLDGMQVSTDSTSDMGSVINAGNYVEAASTRYNYPGTDIAPPAPTLSDVPKYDMRTDDWIGRTGSAPVTSYSFTEGTDTKTTQTTSPDNATTVTVTIKNPGQWNDGLVKETYITSPGRTTPWTKTIYTWHNGDITRGRKNPRIEKIEVVNDVGLSKSTTFAYDIYNNQTLIADHDYAALGTVGPELRRTETIYNTGGQYNVYVYRNLVHLPLSIKKIVNNTVVSRTDYQYDGFNLTTYGPNIPQLDERYNPDTPDGQYCHEECPAGYEDPAFPQICTVPRVTVCDPIPIFDGSTNFRGNVTKITSFVDVYNDNDPNASINELKYDVAGNVVQATMNCCNNQTIEYSSDYNYAYPTKVTKGSGTQFVSEATYDLSTGSILSRKDDNQQTTTFEYESDTLRQKKVNFPNGGFTEVQYSDKLVTGSNLVPGFVLTKTSLDSSHVIQNYNYFDARGLSIRKATQTPDGWSVSAVELDLVGRPVKFYNPFYVSTPTGTIPNGTKYRQILGYDALGRTTGLQLQDYSTVSTEYSTTGTLPTGFNKTFLTTIDEAGRKRRQIIDALGRVVRVDEPNAGGNLGAVDAPTVPTFYEFDGNDNLSKVIQSDGNITQTREFRYDALSRLIYERQVEANPTLDTSGNYGAPSPTKWTKVNKYNSRGLLTESIDARGVKKTLTYDGLNRLGAVSYSDDTPAVTYTYDQSRTGFYNKGSLTRVATAAGTGSQAQALPTVTEFDYDVIGKVKAHRQQIGTQNYALEYNYNLAGQLTGEKYPSGKIVTLTYDAVGRLANLSDQTRSYLGNLQYQSNGGTVSSMTMGNGIQETFDYNDRLQLKKMTWAKNGNVVQRYDYTFGELDSQSVRKNNRKLAQVDSYSGGTLAAPTKQFTQKFDYDSVGRLEYETETRGDNNQQSYRQKFGYDRFGNRYLRASENPSTQNPLLPSTIEDNNMDPAKNRLAVNTGTVYDDAGNVTIDGKFRNLKYYYNASGRMYRSSTTDEVYQAFSTYDGTGQRAATQINGVWKIFIYDAYGKMVAEYGGTPATDEGGVKYNLQDIHGSTRAITSAVGMVKVRIDYQGFGEEIPSSIGQRTAPGYGTSDNLRQRYALTERDEATGLDHTWYRKNETRAGRWTSPDPYNGSATIADPQSFNRYSYVENQPTNFVDPSGLNMEEGGGWWTCTRYHYTNGTTGYWGSWSCAYNPGSGGGGGGGTGQGGNSNISQDCIDALKDLGVWDRVQELLKNPPIYDVDSIERGFPTSGHFEGGTADEPYVPGKHYFGSVARAGENVGTTYDRISPASMYDAYTVRGGSGGGRDGIYYRSSHHDITQDTYLLLHEVTHLAYPPGNLSTNVDLDKALVVDLNITQLKGESYSQTVSRFFNNKCKKSLRNFGMTP